MVTQKAYWFGTDIQVVNGDIIHDFRGDEHVFAGVARDSGNGRSAKVRTEEFPGYYAEVFPGIEVL